MRAQDDAGALAQRRGVVAQPRAVRGPDLDQSRPGLSDDLGDAKAAADLDELPARDDDLAPRARQRRGGQQHGGRAVVDREPGLRAGDLAQQPLDVGVTRAPLAGGQVELEVRVALGRRRHRGPRARRQRSATEVRVHHDAGGVEHASQRGLEPLARPRHEVDVGGVPSEDLRAPLGQLGPRHRRRQPVDRRQLAQSLAHARGRGLGHDFGWYARVRGQGIEGKGAGRCFAPRAVVLSRACRGERGVRLSQHLLKPRTSNVGPTPSRRGKTDVRPRGAAQGVAKRTRTAKGLRAGRAGGCGSRWAATAAHSLPSMRQLAPRSTPDAARTTQRAADSARAAIRARCGSTTYFGSAAL